MISQPPPPSPPPRPLPPPPPPPPQLAHDHPPAGYTCYDIDTDDHAEQCHGSTRTRRRRSPSRSATTRSTRRHSTRRRAPMAASSTRRRSWPGSSCRTRPTSCSAGGCQRCRARAARPTALMRAEWQSSSTNGKYGRTSGAAPTRMTQAEARRHASPSRRASVTTTARGAASSQGRPPDAQLQVRSDKEGASGGASTCTRRRMRTAIPISLNGTQITTIDTTKPNIEYICVRMKLNSDGTRLPISSRVPSCARCSRRAFRTRWPTTS